MLKNKMVVGIAAFIIMMGMLAVGLNYIAAGVITIVAMMIFNAFQNMGKYKDRIELLQTVCDPEAFLQVTRDLKNQGGLGSKMGPYLLIDEAVGLMTLGQFQEAKDTLVGIEIDKLPQKYNVSLIHKMNLMYACYELGEVDEAETVYLDLLPMLSANDPQVHLTRDILLAERAFFLEDYSTSKLAIEPLLERELKKRTKLTLIYRLAQIAEIEGDLASAEGYYTQVAEQGNKLWIASCAAEKLESFKALKNV